MTFSERFKEQIIKHEGLKLTPYRCTAGKITIGVGRNLDDNGITRGEAMMMLNHDIEACEGQLYVSMPWVFQLSDPRRAVLLNMCFNLGFNGLCKFKNMLSACESGDYELAASEMLDSKWAKQVGQRADELTLQMETGEWS
ncbi:glycoside hydrolase family protein [Maridesulfovibrio sp.]|uniref:glycoside hydrolase family protein n=1 Tax=Maridesulfovibrio sp. TaxID=2795000 RepID=UPI002AA88227|nr:glycoside hydrolase family protein [Maridesulfovibrio sp.]